MKYPICVMLILLLLSTSCKKDSLSLPSETQTGANTFGCKVNGKVWVPSGTDVYSGQNVVAKYMHYYPSSNGYLLIISASDKNGSPRSFFTLGSDSVELYEGIKLRITGKKGDGGGRYVTGDGLSQEFYAAENLSGEIYFKKLNKNEQIMSGTFWFDAVDFNGSIIHTT